MHIYIYLYLHTHAYACICIYIYILREEVVSRTCVDGCCDRLAEVSLLDAHARARARAEILSSEAVRSQRSAAGTQLGWLEHAGSQGIERKERRP